MKMPDRQIKNLLGIRKSLEISSGVADFQNKIDTTVIKSKTAFYESEVQNSLTRIEFLYQQGQYIHKRWWVLQGILLLALWRFLKITNSGYYMQRSMGVAAPVFVVLVIPELWKNRCANAMEVECASYFTLRQVYAARLMLFAAVDLILLSVFGVMTVYMNKLTVQELMIQFFLPFSVTCCICFQALYNKWLNSESLSMALCMFWCGLWILVVLDKSIYTMVSVKAWNVLLVLSVLYLGYCIRNGQKKCDETWEA